MADKTQEIRPVMLVIMDTCGWRREEDGNASRPADTAPVISAIKGLFKPHWMTGRVPFSR